jgi:hypothetical protein
MIRNWILLLILTLINITVYSQNIDSLAIKITDKMCDCFGELDSYETYKTRFDDCYNNAISEVISEKKQNEIMLFINPDKKQEVNKKIEILIKTDCESVNQMIQKDILEEDSNNPFPTNFDSKDLKKLKKNIDSWHGEIIAFDALVLDVKKGYQDKTYYKVRLLGGKEIWIASLVNSGFEKKNNILRILGYVSKIEDFDIAEDFHSDKFHILAFGVIDMNSKGLSMLPGSEVQIKEWKNGKVPVGQK